MAYTDDAVRAKLSALNETQESIVTVAQWVMFHRRHADRTAQLWMQRLKDSGVNKRLNLVYLANEVAQQSKARRKDDFLLAFSPIIAEATATAYKGASNEVQQKLRRVVEVWRQRQIFELPIQEAVETRIDDIDKARSSGKKPLLGGSLFSGSPTPKEIQPLIPLQTAVSKATNTSEPALATATIEYEKLTDPDAAVPTPPVHAARLSALVKLLASAEGAVAESIKARTALIDNLDKLLRSNRAALVAEEAQLINMTSRKTTAETRKREVEDSIMRGLSGDSSNGNSTVDTDVSSTGRDSAAADHERPDVEALTPPPVETLTPTGTPPSQAIEIIGATPWAESTDEHPPKQDEPTSTLPPSTIPTGAGSDLLSSLSMPLVRPHAGSQATNGSSVKKRKVDHGEDFQGLEVGM